MSGWIYGVSVCVYRYAFRFGVSIHALALEQTQKNWRM